MFQVSNMGLCPPLRFLGAGAGWGQGIIAVQQADLFIAWAYLLQILWLHSEI